MRNWFTACGFASVNYVGGTASGCVIDYLPTSIELIQVPEPATWYLIFFGVALLWIVRARRQERGTVRLDLICGAAPRQFG